MDGHLAAGVDAAAEELAVLADGVERDVERRLAVGPPPLGVADAGRRRSACRPPSPRPSGASPRRIPSTIRWLERFSRFASPTPVEPAEPTSLSRNSPAPRIGESPTRPGIFHDRPEVVVVQPRSPWVSSTEQWIVPVTRFLMYSWTNERDLLVGRRDPVVVGVAGLLPVEPDLPGLVGQQVRPRGSRGRRANRSAPSPTSRQCRVRFMTSRATAAGCMMLRIEATEPPPWVGPCMTAASSSTTPSSLGIPP